MRRLITGLLSVVAVISAPVLVATPAWSASQSSTTITAILASPSVASVRECYFLAPKELLQVTYSDSGKLESVSGTLEGHMTCPGRGSQTMASLRDRVYLELNGVRVASMAGQCRYRSGARKPCRDVTTSRSYSCAQGVKCAGIYQAVANEYGMLPPGGHWEGRHPEHCAKHGRVASCRRRSMGLEVPAYVSG